MYMTSANECYALDAGSGRPIWHYQRSGRRPGWQCGGRHQSWRGAGRRPVFMVTDNAHIIALHRSAESYCGIPRWPIGTEL